MSGACAGDLEISDCALGSDCGEGEVADFGGGVCEAVEGCGFAGGGFADEGYEGVARHGAECGIRGGTGW